MKGLSLSVQEGAYAVCKLPVEAPIPERVLLAGGFLSITKTNDELSLVCQESYVSDEMRVEQGWRILKVEGPLDFSLTGILAGVAQPLALAQISIFAVSTFDTDYILVKEQQLPQALSALRGEGHLVADSPK